MGPQGQTVLRGFLKEARGVKRDREGRAMSADISQIVSYEIYLLPAGSLLDLDTHIPIATVSTSASDALRSFTGDSSITTDSASAALVNLSAYHAYVVSVDSLGEKTASDASGPTTLIGE